MSLEHALDLIESELTPLCFQVARSNPATSLTVPPAPPVPPKKIDVPVQTQRRVPADLLDALEVVCKDLPITPAAVLSVLSPEAIADWRKSAISGDTLAAFARSLVQRRERDQGKRPAHYTEQATCKHCGPIWLWFSGEVPGCPWCWNRAADKPIPRPGSVHCGDCIHFERIDHPHLGHCATGKPEAIAGWWDMDRHYCERFLPRPKSTNNDQSRPARDEANSEFPK